MLLRFYVLIEPVNVGRWKKLTFIFLFYILIDVIVTDVNTLAPTWFCNNMNHYDK